MPARPPVRLSAPRRRALLRAGLALSVAALGPALSACSERRPGWSLYDVEGHLPDLAFTLSGAGGRTVSAEDLRGQTVLLFFGYANCPDVCPTTMAQLADVLQRLGTRAEQVRIVFISVDPHRDTPDVLQAYVSAFTPRAIGLTGTEKQIAAVAKRYRVAYQIEPPRPGAGPDEYDVTHSRGVFVFDGRGRARLLAAESDNAETIARDLQKLLDESA